MTNFVDQFSMRIVFLLIFMSSFLDPLRVSIHLNIKQMQRLRTRRYKMLQYYTKKNTNDQKHERIS